MAVLVAGLRDRRHCVLSLMMNATNTRKQAPGISELPRFRSPTTTRSLCSARRWILSFINDHEISNKFFDEFSESSSSARPRSKAATSGTQSHNAIERRACPPARCHQLRAHPRSGHLRERARQGAHRLPVIWLYDVIWIYGVIWCDDVNMATCASQSARRCRARVTIDDGKTYFDELAEQVPVHVTEYHVALLEALR